MQGFDCTEESEKGGEGVKGKPSTESVMVNISAIYDGREEA